MRWWPKSVTPTLRVFDAGADATRPISVEETFRESENPRGPRPETAHLQVDEVPRIIQLNPIAGQLIRYYRGHPQAARSKSSPSSAVSPPRSNSGFARLLRGLVLFIVVGGALTFAGPAGAAPITWTGLGGTNDWSEGANWSTGAPPGAGDVAIFDATSIKDATINVATSVSGIQISPGYTGIITQALVTTTVGAAGFTQADGSFLGSNAAITVNGGFTLTGGSFTSTTANLAVSAGFTHTGGSFAPNGGTVTFTGAAATIDVPGTEIFDNLTFAPTTGGAIKTINAGTTLVAQGNLSLTEGSIAGLGSVAVRGNVVQASTFDGGAGLLIIDGSGPQTLTGNSTTAAGALPNLTIAKPAGSTLTLTGTIRTGRNWTLTSGLVDPTTSTVIFAGTLTISGSQSFHLVEVRGAVTVPAVTVLTVAADLTMPTAAAFTVNGSVTVAGNLALTDGSIAGLGSVAVRGNVVQASTFDGGAGLLIIDGSGPQTLTGNSTTAAGALPNLTIAKPAGSTLTLTGTIRTGRNWTLTSGLVDPTTSTVIFAGTLTISGSQSFHLVEVRGAVTVPAVTVLTVAADLTMPTAAAFTVNGSVTVAGNLALTDGSIAGLGSVAVRGNVVQASTFDGGAGLLIIDGSGPQTLTGNSTTAAGALPNLTIAKPAGSTLTLTGTIRTGRNWTLTSGLVDPTTSTVIFAGTLTISGSQSFHLVEVRGAVTVPAVTVLTVAADLTMPTAAAFTVNGSVTVAGNLALTDGSIAGLGSVAVRGNVVQASTFDGGAGLLIIDGSGPQTLTGNSTTAAGALPNLTIAKPAGSTLTLTGTIRTGRNWTLTSGLVDPTTSTVIFAGTLTISGSQSFHLVEVRGAVTVPAVTVLTVAADLTMPTAAAFTVNGSVTVAGNLALTDGSIAGLGSVAVRGNVVQASTFDGGAGLLIIDGSGPQTLTGNSTTAAGALPNLTIAKPAGSTLTLTGTIRTGRNWTLTSGLVDPTTSTVIFAGTLTISGSQSFHLVEVRGAVTVPAVTVLTVAADLTMPTAAAFTVNGSVTVAGNLALTDGSIAGLGSVAVRGNVVQASTFDGGAGLLIIDGSGPQTLTGNSTTAAGALPNLTIAKPAGSTLTLTGTIRTGRNWTLTSGLVDPTTSTVIFAGTLTISGSQSFHLVEVRGAVTVPAVTVLTVAADLTMPTAAAFTVNGSVTVAGNLALTDGSIAGLGSVAVRGNVVQASTFDGGAGLLIIDGSGPQTLTGNSTTAAGALPNLTIAKPAGSTLTLTGTIRTGRNWTLTSGLVDPTTSTVIFAGTELVSVAGMEFSSVTIGGGAVPNGVTLVQGPLVVNGTLTLLSGTITTGATKVVITPTGTVVRLSAHVSGNLEKFVPTGSAIGVTFEIGDVTAYTPIVVSFGTVTTSGDVLASTTAGDHPDIANSGVASTNGVNRWWTITSSAIGFDNYDVVLDFIAADVDPVAVFSEFIVAEDDGSNWTQPTVVARSATSIEAGGLTSFGDFVVGAPAADVGVLMVGSPEPVLVAGTLTYTVTVHNFGPSPASNVVLVDPLPVGVAFQSVATSQGSCSQAGGTVTCLLGGLAVGADATVTIRVVATAPGTVTNTVTVTATETDPQTVNNTATTVSTVSPAADVGVLMVGSPEPVLVAGTLTYTVTVHNFGPSPASNVVLVDPLPVGVAFQSVATSQGSCSQAGGTVTCLLGGLAVGADATVTIRVVATAPGTVTNTVTVTATETDPQTVNNTATTVSTVSPAADVGVLMVGSPEPVLVAGTLTYTVTVHNFGPSPASNVVLVDPLPVGVAFQSVATSQGSCSQAGGTVTCLLGGLAVGADATVTIRVVATAPGTVTNTVTVTATETDPQTVNNTATTVSTVSPAADVGVLMVGSPEPVLVAGTLTYTVTVHNFGPSPASNVVLVDPLPVGVAFQSVATSQGSCSQAGGTVTCLLGGLAVGADATVTIRVVATAPGTVTNTVTVTATETDPQTVNNTATTVSTKNSTTPPPAEDDSKQVAAPEDDGKSSEPFEGPDSPDLVSHQGETVEPQNSVLDDLPRSVPIAAILVALGFSVGMLFLALGPRGSKLFERFREP